MRASFFLATDTSQGCHCSVGHAHVITWCLRAAESRHRQQVAFALPVSRRRRPPAVKLLERTRAAAFKSIFVAIRLLLLSNGCSPPAALRSRRHASTILLPLRLQLALVA